MPENISESCLEIKTSDENIHTVDVEPTELKTSVKIFIAKGKKEALQEAIDNCKYARYYHYIHALIYSFRKIR